MDDHSSLFLLIIVVFVLMYVLSCRYYRTSNVNACPTVSLPSPGASFPRVWARASFKDSSRCGTCPSSALGVRTRIPRFPDGVGLEERRHGKWITGTPDSNEARKGDIGNGFPLMGVGSIRRSFSNE